MTAKEFFEFAKKNGAGMVDLKFVDFLGTWQHCTFPTEFLDEGAMKEGLGFDGSSIRGWQMIHQSDLASPGGSTAFRTRCTRRSVLVKVPSFSAKEAAGSTTCACLADSVKKMSCTT